MPKKNWFDATACKCIKQIVVFGPFYCFHLLWNETKPFSGQKLAIFSNFIAHGGSKNYPDPRDFGPKKFSVPTLITKMSKSPNCVQKWRQINKSKNALK